MGALSLSIEAKAMKRTFNLAVADFPLGQGGPEMRAPIGHHQVAPIGEAAYHPMFAKALKALWASVYFAF